MPRKATFTRDEVVEKALQIVRRDGIECLTARSLGAELGSSPSPIFTLFKGMEEVSAAVWEAAQQVFSDYVADVTDFVPSFKEFGLRQVRFARQDPQLFRYLFLRPSGPTEIIHPKAAECLHEVASAYGFSEEQSRLLFRQMWTFNCGLASLSMQNPRHYTEKVVSEMLAFQFISTLMFFKSGRQLVDIRPHRKKPGEGNILIKF